MTTRPLCGIFVGGQSRRMGGHPKGLLPAPATTGSPDGAGRVTLVARLVALAQAHGLKVVLVGQNPDYATLSLPMLADRPPGRGPLGGLAALLIAAGEQGCDGAIALSCDLPFLGPQLLARMLDAPTEAWLAVAPRWQPPDRDQPIWEPLCARYSLAFLPTLQAAIEQGIRSLQPLLSQGRTLPLSLDVDEQAQVRDWDRPEDLPVELRAVLSVPRAPRPLG